MLCGPGACCSWVSVALPAAHGQGLGHALRSRHPPAPGCCGAPSCERGRNEPEEPQSVGKSQKTIYSFLQMATSTIWLTNTDEQA